MERLRGSIYQRLIGVGRYPLTFTALAITRRNEQQRGKVAARMLDDLDATLLGGEQLTAFGAAQWPRLCRVANKRHAPKMLSRCYVCAVVTISWFEEDG